MSNETRGAANDPMTRKWDEEERRERWQVVSGVLEFVGVIVGAVAILLLLAILISLVSWLVQDVRGTFAILFSRLK